MPDVTTLCNVCGMPASSRCRLCGKMVCEMHYDARSGLCTSCKGRGRSVSAK